ncbi:hypothetical protein [Anaerosporobacter sp.]|uniref:hypothetical protein n=1 Tax=Anaerosporobacter sp. TaxID=1872529 RepID=UPI00286F2D63|nr:hypothetical protein [Anaerosporobacter sp.]
MNTYDIREQIKRENRNKLIGEIGVVLFLLAIIFSIIFIGKLSNPFHVIEGKEGLNLEKEYDAGASYVKVTDASLEFTGYYKEDKNGKILYNCYATLIGEEQFFVFVPASRSGEDIDSPEELLTNYSFTAHMHTDADLLNIVAEDYKMTTEEWIDTGVISTIVLDEANSDMTRMYIIWVALICVVLLCLAYCIVSYNNLKDIYKRKEVMDLTRYGEVDNILDCINEEVDSSLEFDSINMKITKNYLIAFINGKIYIGKRTSISKVEVVSKVKKVYGIVKLGYEDFLQIYEGDKKVFEIPSFSEVEVVEVLTIMNSD